MTLLSMKFVKMNRIMNDLIEHENKSFHRSNQNMLNCRFFVSIRHLLLQTNLFEEKEEEEDLHLFIRSFDLFTYVDHLTTRFLMAHICI